MGDIRLAIGEQLELALQNLGAKPEDLAAEHDSKALVELMRSLGAKPDLLSLVGSYGNGLSNEDVLTQLRRWNEVKSAERAGP
jgi:hypothetical protein